MSACQNPIGSGAIERRFTEEISQSTLLDDGAADNSPL